MKTVVGTIEDDITPKFDRGGRTAFALRSREHKGVQCVIEMLVAQNGNMGGRKRTISAVEVEQENGNAQLHARSASDFNRGGGRQ